MNFFYGWTARLVILTLIVCHGQGGEVANVRQPKVIHKGIHKRGLFYPVLLYPYNACSGILVAIAIPLALPNRNVFLSYNFEMNYNMPNQPSDSFPGMITRFPGLKPPSTQVDAGADAAPDDITLGGRNLEEKTEEATSNSSTTETEAKRAVTSDSVVLSRKGIYRVLESRLSANGIDGKKCLLFAICEAAMYPLLEANGVLGHILHIFLTPSSSNDEDLPAEYTKAENLGQQNKCQKYQKRCGFSLLSTFSKLI